MNFITDEEHNMIHQLTGRLSMVVSPVLRLQAIMSFSQHIDMLMLGDTSKSRMKEMYDENNELQKRVDELEEKLGLNEDDDLFSAPDDRSYLL